MFRLWLFIAIVIGIILATLIALYIVYWAVNHRTAEEIRLDTIKANYDTCPKSSVVYDIKTDPYVLIWRKKKVRRVYLLREGCK